MTFMVTLITLLIERFFDWSHLRHWSWYTGYQQVVAQKFPQKPSYLILAFTIVPLLILVALFEFLFRNMLYGLIELIFQAALVLYCLGPQSLWADAFAGINALVSGNKNPAEKQNAEMEAEAPHLALCNKIFIEANRRVFAPLFWFVLIGPVGIVLYRTIALSANEALAEEDKTELSQQAQFVKTILDWAPARLMALLFAMGKHFSKVFSVFCHHVLSGLDKNEVIVADCGNAAISETEKTAEEASLEKSALNLLDRSFALFLVLVVIVVWVI